MKISFIVTSYNYEKYILETIESIKNQTIDDFEIIVVDDCSQDNSVAKLKEISGIKLICHSRNKGQLATIITGLKEAKGQFVSIIDSDDTIEPNYAEILIQELLNNDVSLVCCNGIQNETITYKTNKVGGWYWAPMSSGMFKKEVLDCIINYNNADLWKICPDKLLFNLAHIQGNSRNISDKLMNKREHGKNAGLKKTRFFVNVKNNFIIRHDLRRILKNSRYDLIIINSYIHIFNQIVNFCNTKAKKL